MKFLCDQMLGTLAKWLRIFGFDTSYPGPLDDGELIALAASENRAVLTRDKELASKIEGSLYIQSDNLDQQIEQVMGTFHLKIEEPMSRCSVCNSPIVEVEKSKIKGEVPEGVFSRQNQFWKCPNCFKYYWQGSHWEKIVKKIEKYRSRSSSPQ